MEDVLDRILNNFSALLQLSLFLIRLFQEVQRLGNIVPVNLFHATTKEVILNGYRIPKGTPVIPQISTVLYDEKVRLTSTSIL